jgi:hypothetical protein
VREIEMKNPNGMVDCFDNAVAESFFATLKTEHIDHET